jgi:hypothetical protein
MRKAHNGFQGDIPRTPRISNSNKAFPLFSYVVNEFEKAKIQRKLFLRNLSMGSQPGTKQGPETFHGVDVHFVKPVLIVILCIFTLSMMNHLMLITPFLQSSVDAVVVGINKRVRCAIVSL